VSTISVSSQVAGFRDSGKRNSALSLTCRRRAPDAHRGGVRYADVGHADHVAVSSLQIAFAHLKQMASTSAIELGDVLVTGRVEVPGKSERVHAVVASVHDDTPRRSAGAGDGEQKERDEGPEGHYSRSEWLAGKEWTWKRVVGTLGTS
jgi:cbb3-type cytochrome oxidase cytochrome c subunit